MTIAFGLRNPTTPRGLRNQRGKRNHPAFLGRFAMPDFLPPTTIDTIRTDRCAASLSAVAIEGAWPGLPEAARMALGTAPEPPGRPTEAGELPTLNSAEPVHGPRHPSGKGVSVAQRQKARAARDEEIATLLAGGGGARLVDIRKSIGCAPGTLVSALNRLIAAGQVERIDDAYHLVSNGGHGTWAPPLSASKSAREAHLTAA
jgi:hypothetical protein